MGVKERKAYTTEGVVVSVLPSWLLLLLMMVMITVAASE